MERVRERKRERETRKSVFPSDFGLTSRVFANGPGDRGSIPGHVIPNTQKNST